MDVKIIPGDGVTTVEVSGRLDTTNVHEFEKAIEPLLASIPKETVLECSGFDYISSSGLRILLTLQKQVSAAGAKLIMRNVRQEIKDVFDMTGFSSIFTIE